jgi:hypothetical protein
VSLGSRSSVLRHCRFVVLVAGTSLSLAGRVANGIQDVLDIVLDMGELHRHLLHRGGGGRGVQRRRGGNDGVLFEFLKVHHIATANPPPAFAITSTRPSIFQSDSDSQHSFTYLWKCSESSTLISLISVAKSEFSRDFAYPTTRNAAQTSPTPRRMPQSLWDRVPSSCGPSERRK